MHTEVVENVSDYPAGAGAYWTRMKTVGGCFNTLTAALTPEGDAAAFAHFEELLKGKGLVKSNGAISLPMTRVIGCGAKGAGESRL